MEEDCVRGMICDPEEGCRWPGEEERANYPGVDPDEELPLCTMFRRMNEERRGE